MTRYYLTKSLLSRLREDNSSLKTLKLIHFCVDERCASSMRSTILPALLQGNEHDLRRRDATAAAAGSYLGEQGGIHSHMMTALAAGSGGREFDAIFCELRADSWAELAAALRTCSSVQCLDVSGMDVGPEGALAVASIIRDSRCIVSVRMSGCNIRTEGAKAIASALARNRSVADVDLSSNRIGSKGAKALAAALQENQASAMARLNLGQNLIGTNGIIALTQMLRRSRSLRLLDVASARGIDAEAAGALADAVLSNESSPPMKLYVSLGQSSRVCDAVANALSRNADRVCLSPGDLAAVRRRLRQLPPPVQQDGSDRDPFAALFDYPSQTVAHVSSIAETNHAKFYGSLTGLYITANADGWRLLFMSLLDVGTANLLQSLCTSRTDALTPEAMVRLGQHLGAGGIFEFVKLKPTFFVSEVS